MFCFKKMRFSVVVALVTTSLLAGCSSSPKVQSVQMGDNNLSKQELLAEMAKLDVTEKEIKSKKGVNGTNAASALLFWPGLVYTYMDANEADALVRERRMHLTNLYNQKYSKGEKATTQAQANTK